MAITLLGDGLAQRCVLFVQPLPLKTASLNSSLSPLRRWSTANVLRNASRRVPSLSASTPSGFPLRLPNQNPSRASDNVGPSPAPLRPPTSASSRYLQSLSTPRVATPRETIKLGRFAINLSPRFLLCLVPLLGASFVICAKLLYLLPCALPPPVFNSLRLIVASLIVSPIVFREIRSLCADRSHFKKIWPGIQLGMLVFMANMLQILGLRYAPASRAAFINQLSTVLVPLTAAALSIEPLTMRVAAGSVAALAGIGLLTAPAANAATSAAVASTSYGFVGDILELASAGFNTAYVIRMGHYAQSLPPSRLLPISAVKVVIQATMSLFWLGFTSAVGALIRLISKSLTSLVATVATEAPNSITTAAAAKAVSAAAAASAASATAATWTPFAILCNVFLVLWAGGVSNTISAWLQIKGQSSVSASESAVLFASQPLWASVFAVILLRESMPLAGMIGAALIIIGAVLASTGKKKKQ